MNELNPVYAMAALIVGLIVCQAIRRKLDPFAPVWLFLVGYTQVYVVQALSYHEWAIRVRGVDLVAQANLRALWALVWFLAVYHVGIGRFLARRLPRPPMAWSPAPVAALSPLLIAWGLICSGMVLRGNANPSDVTAEESLFRSFPAVMLVAAALLIVTGRKARKPAVVAMGVAVGAAYVLIWMFNGKRSHSLLGLLMTICVLYVTRQKRPSWPTLALTAVAGAVVVTLAIGWRGNKEYETSFSGFFQYVGDFDPSKILVNLNMQDRTEQVKTYETEEYGGFLLMMDTVPEKSEYDYGAPYLRVFTTFIPRIVWPDKPLPGRKKWIAAWQAGSELPREENFTGPAIGILGATQLNGGPWGTLAVLGCLGLLLRTTYEYFLRYETVPWVQAWWALTYYNAWFMTVADDPLNWFYYNYGFTTMPPMLIFWIYNAIAGRARRGAVAPDGDGDGDGPGAGPESSA